MSVCGTFVEPPFLFDKSVVSAEHGSWSSLLRDIRFETMAVGGPGEFNDQKEFSEFKEYVREQDATNE